MFGVTAGWSPFRGAPCPMRPSTASTNSLASRAQAGAAGNRMLLFVGLVSLVFSLLGDRF